VNSEAFQAQLAGQAETLGVSVDSAALERMAAHQALLARWAPRVNLVGNPDPRVTLETHFLDSLALLRLLPEDANAWTDVGSGAGFPGAVLAAARPAHQWTLLEPLEKRVSFLTQVAAGMRECGISVELGRTDGWTDRSQSALISRAVLPPPRWMTECGRLLQGDGRAVLMTAHGPDEETQQAAQAAGLVEEARDQLTLPGGAPRCNVLYRKEP